MSKDMNRIAKQLIFLIVLVLLFVALDRFSVPAVREPGSDEHAAGASRTIAIRGTMVCLPHKDMSGPQTMECAFGLRSEAGEYYALLDTDPDYRNVSSAPFDVLVEVKGMFTPDTDTKYQSIGTIAVESLLPVEAPAAGVPGWQ